MFVVLKTRGFKVTQAAMPAPTHSHLLLTTLLLSCLAPWTAAAGDWRKPDFCGDADCPEFTIWQKSHQFQEREYKAASWIATTVLGSKLEVALHRGARRLEGYLDGDNADGMKMPDTLPLGVHFKLDLHPHTGHRRNYTVAAFLPYSAQTSAPLPTNEELFIYCHTQARMYVRMFRQPPTEVRIIKEARALAAALDRAGHGYEGGEVIAAMYGCAHSRHDQGTTADESEDLTKHRHRCRHPHSEVWLRASQPNTTQPQPR